MVVPFLISVVAFYQCFAFYVANESRQKTRETLDSTFREVGREKYGKNAPWHTTRKTDRERDLAWLISSSVHQTVIELVPKRKKGRGPRYFSGCFLDSPPPSPPPYTPYKLDVVFNFFEWTLVRRQSQTNNQAICGKANSSLDATLVISAAGFA